VWEQWKVRVKELKQDTFALYLASLDPRVPWLAKLIIGVVVAYALSPVDLIPDFIPVLGYLDDLMLIPVGMAAAIKMIPVHVWEYCKARSRASLYSKLPHSKAAVIVIVILWITAIAWFGGLVWPFFDEQRY
jgi:uncharacterized membrane protein YkvA (DUF1232 family)